MDVSDDAKAPASAYFPKRTKKAPVKMYDAGIEAMRVQVVVKHKVDNSTAVSFSGAKKKCTAFPRFSAPAFAKVPNKSTPNKPGARQFMPRRPQAPNSRCN